MKKNWLVIGLGNPEGKYFRTYHNIGFLCAELLAKQDGINAEFKKKGNQMLAKTDFGFILKPLTYMNLSGQAVAAVTRKYKITPESIIVFTDDLYIDKGSVRITFGGSNAGHNGIKSITELLGTNQYIKIKVGIKPEKPPHNTADYVLKKIDEQSRPLVELACEKAVQAAVMLLDNEGLPKVQNTFNTRQDA